MPASPSARVRIAARSICAAIPRDDVFMAAVASVIGIQLPVTPNRAASGQGLAALWLGPDEWLIVAAPAARRILPLPCARC